MRYTFALLAALILVGWPQLGLAAIPLTSNTEAECSSEGGTCSTNDRNCFRLNTTTTAPRYDPIGYCDGASGNNACCKVGATAAGPTPAPSTPISTFNYTLLEEIPGTAGTSGDFGSYLQSLYRFTFFGIGIAALFMLTVGGFMYVTSAGNTSRVETAKTIITDSFLGILIALFAWLFLYVINPDLVERMPVAAPLAGGGLIGGGGATPTPGPTPGTPAPGACQVAPSGPCSVANMQNSCWGSKNLATEASKICNYESSNNPANISKTDLCLDLKGFSVGLFQINLIANGSRVAPECRGENVFTLGDGSPMPPSLVGRNGGRTTQPNPYTPGRPEFNLFNCKVKDLALYNSCLSRTIEVRKNLDLACGIYDSQGWGAWPYTYETVCRRSL